MEDRNYGTIRIKLDEMIEKQNTAGYRCFSQVVLCIEL